MINIQEIPIKYKGVINEQIKVECEIWAVDNRYLRIFDFVVDTGATMSGISEDVAIQLGYDPSDPLYFDDMDTAGGIEEKMPVIEVSMINIHGIKIEKPQISCNKNFDIINIHGVLGLDFLTAYNLCINFDKNFIKICERKEAIPTP